MKMFVPSGPVNSRFQLWSKLSTILIFVFFSRAGLSQNSVPGHEQYAAGPKVTVIEFADFQCPFCARQAADLRKLQTEYAGRIEVIFKNFPLPFHSRARAAHLAAWAAGKQGKFWEMHDLIFAHPMNLSQQDFDGYADQLALDKERFHKDMEDASAVAAMVGDINEGKRLGISGTPAFVINGHTLVGLQSYSSLKRTVDAVLQGKTWRDSVAPANSGKTEVNITGAPVLGPPDASVTIVEFSDFQCPFCARAVPWLHNSAGVGKNIRWVFKNFPLDFHPDSRLAHMAALAAGEQGKFWEMHDLIFAHQRTIQRDNLLAFAAQLQLDLVRFQKDLDRADLKAKIEADESEGKELSLTGTPSFLVNGQLVTGFSEKQLNEAVQQAVDRPLVENAASLPDLDLSFGPKNAPIKIEWYADLCSPLTPQSAVILQQFLAAHPGTVRVTFRNYPLPNRETSQLVHEFALAAAAQGRFWAVEAMLLADKKPKDRDELKLLAAQLGLDQGRLWAEVDANKYSAVISRDLSQAKKDGVTGTPTFVVGNKKFDGVKDLSMF